MSLKPVICLLGLVAAGIAAAGASASFHVRHWTSEDGLPASRIAALAQTPDGYLWVGTWFGLARFDGVRFVVFNRANTPALPVEAISALAVDRMDGTLWIGTHRGLARFKDGRFERVAETGDSMKWDISELAASSAGGVWIRAGNKVGRWPPAWDGWRKLPFLHAERCRAMWETDDGGLEVMTHRRFFRVQREGSAVQLEARADFPTDEAWTDFWPKDREKRSWLATARELKRFENDGWRTLRVLPGRTFPSDHFLEDRAGAMWVAHSGAGLWRYTDDSEKALYLGARGAEKSVDCLTEDREGHIWAGTPQGLFQIRSAIIRAITEEDGLPHRECWSVSEAPDGAVWVGTKHGLARLHGGRVADALRNEPNVSRAPSILVDREGWLWGGHKHNGVTRSLPDRETNRFWHRPGLGAISGIGLDALYQDQNHRVWAGTTRGPVWFENGQPAVGFGEHGLPTNSIRSIYQTRDGAMWFGTWMAGAVRWEGRSPGFGVRQPSAALDSATLVARQSESARGLAHSKTLARLSFQQAERAEQLADTTRFTTADGLADDRVFVFHEDAEGALWIGTHDGLSRFKDGRFFTFRTEQGLFFNLINWMEEDDFGRFWFSCNRGIFRMDRAELNDVAEGRKSPGTCRRLWRRRRNAKSRNEWRAPTRRLQDPRRAHLVPHG